MREIIEAYIEIISDDPNELFDFLNILREIMTDLEISVQEEE